MKVVIFKPKPMLGMLLRTMFKIKKLPKLES